MSTTPPPEVPAERWEHFPHVADMGVRGFGGTLGEAFAAAAHAMTAVITDPETVRPEISVEVRAQAADPEILFYDFLNGLVYEMAVNGLLFSRFCVQIEGDRLLAEAWGEKTEVARHQPCVEVKGATFTQLDVRREDDGRWVAQCVLDI
ncbi:archease [Thioalkalivibrio sp. ALJ15]|uniref:archease n=1 Tax=Thioalkalivibrio sp. ALJ15 TaxID=748652 RepID=UPI00048CBFDA|nr:archease [Thioalkalivibrio sp. ALJ15]